MSRFHTCHNSGNVDATGDRTRHKVYPWMWVGNWTTVECQLLPEFVLFHIYILGSF